MNCPKCNKKNSDDSIYCMYCGKELKVEETIKTEITNTNQSRINPLALAGFIVSMISACTAIFGIIGIVGIVLSAVGLSQINKNNERGKGFALAGLIVGILGVVFGIFRVILLIIMQIFD